MITVTEQAKELFLGAEYPEGTVLRLDQLEVDQATGRVEIGLLAGEPKVGDQIVEHEGEGLLHIAEPVSEALDGSTIDTVETPEGPKIDILPPLPEDMLGPKPSVTDHRRPAEPLAEGTFTPDTGLAPKLQATTRHGGLFRSELL